MTENEQKCNGVYLSFDCFDAIYQLDPEEAIDTLRTFVSLRNGEYNWEEAWGMLDSDAQRCAFVMLDRFSKPEA